MSIANEIQRLQGAKADIKAAIENKGVTVGDGTIDTYAEKIAEISGGGSGDYEQGYEDGKNSVVQIDRAAKTITFVNLNTLGKTKVVLNLDNVTTLSNLFQVANADNENTTVERLTINTKNKITSMAQSFYCHTSGYDKALKHLTLNVDTSDVTTFNLCFNNQRTLETIDGTPLNLSSTTNVSNMFGYTNSLVEVRFVPNTISKSIAFSQSANLSTETIQSIIDGLADLTGGTAQTLTLHSTVGGKLTDTQKATITAKNWELVY